MRAGNLGRAGLLVLAVVLSGCGRGENEPVATSADPQGGTPAPAATEPQTAPTDAATPADAVAAEPAPADAVAPAGDAASVPESSPESAAAAAGSVAAPAPVDPAPAAAGSSPAAGVPQYAVECTAGAAAAEQCQVDKDTYIGWRTFAAQCQVCHGGSALGSTFAPNLLDRFNQNVDFPRFKDVVLNGFRGQVGAMPPWKDNPQVAPNVDHLYRYLRARADNKLPPGRPAKKAG